jgi:hypothetical protein
MNDSENTQQDYYTSGTLGPSCREPAAEVPVELPAVVDTSCRREANSG